MDNMEAKYCGQDFRNLTDREAADHIIAGLFDVGNDEDATSIGPAKDAIQHLQHLTPEALRLIDWNRHMRVEADILCGRGFDSRPLLTRTIAYMRRRISDGFRPDYYLNPPDSAKKREQQEMLSPGAIDGN